VSLIHNLDTNSISATLSASRSTLCPPGYTIDENGFCNPDTTENVPDVSEENTSQQPVPEPVPAPASCYDVGYSDGLNEQFDQPINCEVSSQYDTSNDAKSYYQGYINGCMITYFYKTLEMCEQESGQESVPESVPELVSFENSTFGVRMDYPSNWELGPGSSTYPITIIAEFYSPEINDYASVNLVAENLSNSFVDSPILDEYLLYSIDGYRMYPDHFPDFTLNYSSAVTQTLSGRPAYSLVGNFIDPELGYRNVMELGMIKDELAYYIQYFASPSKYAKYLPMLENMIDSFQLTR
jgi:hypothetical protein